MTDVRFPAHKLCYPGEGTNVLLAAVGTTIQSLSLINGQCLSVWPRDEGEDSSGEDEIGDRPVKRLKLENEQNGTLPCQNSEASDGSIEIKTEGKLRQKGERRKPKIPDLTLPHVSHLVTTSNGQYAVAITAEDKAVRVLKISQRGRLTQLSSRAMPKKSCALALTHDESTILTADKFGDVYALPLHPTADYKSRKILEASSIAKPSASALTVHTKGNLEALRQQQMQKQLHQRKEGPDFEHKLLLGHVSLLTDLVIARGTVQGKSRSFILTSDRDEHIRVSRGIPQAHIIHTFCMGHYEFVSKLCILPWAEETLVAGNGEPSLRVYNWLHGKETCRLDLRDLLRKNLIPQLSPERSMDRLSISGIWPVVHGRKRGLLVALEGIALLFSFAVDAKDIHLIQKLPLEGNILDIVDLPDQQQVIVSIDNIHKSGSTREYRSAESDVISSVQIFSKTSCEVPGMVDEAWGIRLEGSDGVHFEIKEVSISSLVEKRDNAGYSQDKGEDKVYSELGEFLYGLENLRKRRGPTFERDEDDAEVVEPEQDRTSEMA